MHTNTGDKCEQSCEKHITHTQPNPTYVFMSILVTHVGLGQVSGSQEPIGDAPALMTGHIDICCWSQSGKIRGRNVAHYKPVKQH